MMDEEFTDVKNYSARFIDDILKDNNIIQDGKYKNLRDYWQQIYALLSNAKSYYKLDIENNADEAGLLFVFLLRTPLFISKRKRDYCTNGTDKINIIFAWRVALILFFRRTLGDIESRECNPCILFYKKFLENYEYLEFSKINYEDKILKKMGTYFKSLVGTLPSVKEDSLLAQKFALDFVQIKKEFYDFCETTFNTTLKQLSI